MVRPAVRRLAMIGVMASAVAACDRGTPSVSPQPNAPVSPAATAAAPAAPGPSQAELGEMVETTREYVLGISFPPDAAKYPPLAAELRGYADRARAELLAAVAQRKAEPGAPLYDLTLSFTEVLDTPSMMVIAADGSTYTGGEHSRPLLARFTWLVRDNRLLKVEELVPDAESWKPISAEVRRQLHMALAQRVDAEGLPPAERAKILKTAGAVIDEGTTPEAANFATFEPVLAGNGRIGALRFVFPPFQANGYADGTQMVQLPADVLLPHVAPQFRPLFVGAAG